MLLRSSQKQVDRTVKLSGVVASAASATADEGKKIAFLENIARVCFVNAGNNSIILKR
jgi:hypothetical protein